MKQFQRDFIEFALRNDVLKFGEYQLKSGRKSPYFFNAGLFNSGSSLSSIGKFYASALQDYLESNPDFKVDLLFGPAYKGIPLVSATAISLFAQYQRSLPYAFNRKEAKDHGEGGNLVGATLTGNVLVVDDVITAGTAIRETVKIIKSANSAKLAGVIVALDRQERGQASKQSAIQEIECEFGVKVITIIRLDHIIEYLTEKGDHKDVVDAIKRYRVEFGSE